MFLLTNKKKESTWALLLLPSLENISFISFILTSRLLGSPFLCPFKRPEPDASKVILLNLDQPGQFTVDARNGGGNGVLEVSVYGAYVPAHRIAVEHNGDFTFNVTYDLPKHMETTITVKWHGVHVCNSPFTVTFEN